MTPSDLIRSSVEVTSSAVPLMSLSHKFVSLPCLDLSSSFSAFKAANLDKLGAEVYTQSAPLAWHGLQVGLAPSHYYNAFNSLKHVQERRAGIAYSTFPLSTGFTGYGRNAPSLRHLRDSTTKRPDKWSEQINALGGNAISLISKGGERHPPDERGQQ